MGVSPGTGCAGDVVIVEGTNFALDPDLHRVTFVAADFSGVAIPGQILGISNLGVDSRGNLVTALEVVVPTGVRDSLVVLESIDGDEYSTVGFASFGACPVINGVVHGADNGSFVAFDPLGGFFPSELTLTGFNLHDATSVTFVDETGHSFNTQNLSPGPPLGAQFDIPSSLESITVSYPSGFFFVDCEESARLRVSVTTPEGLSNEVEIRVRLFPASVPGDIPPTITGVHLPSGVRAGAVEIVCSLLSQSGALSYRLVPEYFDPSLGVYRTCTLLEPDRESVEPTVGSVVVLGPLGLPNEVPPFVGLGHANRFLWDSALDLAGQAGATQLRLRTVLEGTAPPVVCPTTEWITEVLAFDHTGPTPAAIVETFDTRAFENLNATDADWDTMQGVLRGTATTPADMFGRGTSDLVLADGHAYRLDTDTGVILDVTSPGAPLDVLPGNPGALDHEFHVRTLLIGDRAEITVIGRRPLVFRCSGVGIERVTVATIEGTIDLSGESGGEPGGGAFVESARPGGRPGPGGGAGGDGGRSVLNESSGFVTGVEPARAGSGPSGGGAGASNPMQKLIGSSGFLSGAGGGGGFGTAGRPGRTFLSAAVGRPGFGGSAVGDARLLDGYGGSGGGGGGGSICCSSDGFAELPGGGGGGGGGAFEIVVDGSLSVIGRILCDGGDGVWTSNDGNRGAPGGGGSGGAIVLRASGSIVVAPVADLSVGAGAGGLVSNQVGGGDGGEGRIRLEANGGLLYPGAQGEVSLAPGVPFPAFVQSVTSVDGGSGVDGVLDLTGESGVFVVNTDTGQVLSPSGVVVFSSNAGSGLFHLTEFKVPEAVEFVGRGSQPLIFRVQGDVRIDGTIIVSGEDGTAPDLSDPTQPLPGRGGAGGPAGGAGGDGGVSTPLISRSGRPGELSPLLPPELIGGLSSPVLPTSTPIGLPEVRPAEGGATSPGAPRAGAGGGGGFGFAGKDGRNSPANTGPPIIPSGLGGRSYGNGSAIHPLTFAFLPVGGSGGGGGGGHPEPPEPGLADHSPGSGGGGGGGFLQISATGNVTLGGHSRLLANGGDAYSAAGKAGSAGGGSGGSIRLRADGMFRFEEPLPVVEASGGRTNLAPPAGMSYPIEPEIVGGRGGPGRIRFEAPIGFQLGPSPCGTFNGYCASVGSFLEGIAGVSVAESRPYRVSSSGGAVGTARRFEAVDVTPRLAPGSGNEDVPSFQVYFSGARESQSIPGTAGVFSAWTDDVTQLPPVDFVRVRVRLYGDPSTGQQPEVERLEIRFGF